MEAVQSPSPSPAPTHLCLRCGCSSPPPGIQWYDWVLGVFLLFAYVVPAFLYVWYAERRGRRCPQCKVGPMFVHPLAGRLAPGDTIEDVLDAAGEDSRVFWFATTRALWTVDIAGRFVNAEETPWAALTSVEVHYNRMTAATATHEMTISGFDHARARLFLRTLERRRPDLRIQGLETLPSPEGAALEAALRSPAHAPGEAPATSASYMVRHWRGEFSLPRAYWVNGFLGNILVNGAGKVMDTLNWSAYRLSAALYLVAWGLIGAALAWQNVGLWRTAARYVREGLGSFWPRFVQVIVVVTVAVWMIALVTMAPVLHDMAWVALGNESDKFQVTALNERELLISGELAFGVAEAFQALLLANPRATIVHLTSNGGRVHEGEALMKLIRQRQLTAYVPSYCESACTVAFLGGRLRIMREGAVLGFHKPGLAGMSADFGDDAAELDAGLFRAAGIADDFIEKMHTSDFEDIWHPSEFELQRAGLVDAFVNGYEYVDSDRVGLDPKKYESGLLEQKVFRNLKTADEAAFSWVAGEYLRDTEGGMSRGDAVARMLARVFALRNEMAPWSSRAAFFDFLETTRHASVNLIKAGGERCLAAVHPEQLDHDGLAPLGDVWEPLMDNAADVFATFDVAREIPPPETLTQRYRQALRDVEAFHQAPPPTGEARADACLRHLKRLGFNEDYFDDPAAEAYVRNTFAVEARRLELRRFLERFDAMAPASRAPKDERALP